MNRSTPGLPVHHHLPEFTQTQGHRVGDAIQPSHPLSSPSPPAPNPSQHQSLFQWVNSSHEVAKVILLILFFTNICRFKKKIGCIIVKRLSNEEGNNLIYLWNWLPVFRQELKILIYSYDSRQEHLLALKENVFFLHNPRKKFKVSINNCILPLFSPLPPLEKKRVRTKRRYQKIHLNAKP